MKANQLYVISSLMAMLVMTITACASGLVGSKEEKLGLSGSSGLFCSFVDLANQTNETN